MVVVTFTKGTVSSHCQYSSEMAAKGKESNASLGVGRQSLEKVILCNSVSKFGKSVRENEKPQQSELMQDENRKNTFLSKVCWWEPPQDSLPVEFCRNSSIHGLSFIGKPHLHLSERIFWTIAFILGVVAAVLLINDVWQRYYQNPVIVAFQAEEVDVDTLPFPAVTICSMNAFPKSQVQRLQKDAREHGTEKARKAREALKFVREICNSQQSFSKEFRFAHSRGKTEEAELGQNDTFTEDTENQMLEFLMEYTLPCHHLIRLCMFAEKKRNCSRIFKPLITDYGKCCTFNIMPLPLLLTRFQINETVAETRETEQNDDRWSRGEIRLWRTWNYDKDGFILRNKLQPRPYRQKRAGLPYGLSILVDPNLDDWYCPVSDSEGFRFILHNSLEMPIVNEFASLIQLNQEIMTEVRPEVTNADDIRNFPREARNCYFPEERQLDFYGPYSAGNCVAECTATVLEKKCNCTYFYMPRHPKMGICNSDPESNDFKCTIRARTHLLEYLKTECQHCESLCEDIEYHFETTTATLQDPLKLWKDFDPKQHGSQPPWADHKVSIIHTFMGTETVVPKLRQRMYGTTDLIANTGGLLGLCLGFSILSAMELVYFLSLRAFWRICRRRNAKRRKSKLLSSIPRVGSDTLFLNRERIIQLHPTKVPLVQYPVQIAAWRNYIGPSNPAYTVPIVSPSLMNKKIT